MILTSGCFDGLHFGHVWYLDEAAQYKDGREDLYVAVAPDSYIRSAKCREPYWPQRERCETVRALKMVDAIWPQESQSVAPIVRLQKPRLFIKGKDWEGKLPADVVEACLCAGTKIVFVETESRHTSEARC